MGDEIFIDGKSVGYTWAIGRGGGNVEDMHVTKLSIFITDGRFGETSYEYFSGNNKFIQGFKVCILYLNYNVRETVLIESLLWMYAKTKSVSGFQLLIFGADIVSVKF